MVSKTRPWHRIRLRTLIQRVEGESPRPQWSWWLEHHANRTTAGVRSHTGRMLQISLGAGKCRARLWKPK
jgi:hypothetical protein